MSEASITSRITRWLKNRPESVTLKIHGSSFQRAGEPDVLHMERGLMFALEIKTATGKATRLQLHRLDQWRAAGATAAVVRSVEEVREVVECASS